MRPDLFPEMTLGDIYGGELAFAPTPSPKTRNWLPQDPVAIEMLSGGMLTIADDMPVLCAASVATAEGMQLLRDAGFAEARNLVRYKNNKEHNRQIAKLLGKGLKIALQHAPHPSEARPDAYWINPETLAFLNNKGHLTHLVDADQLPARHIVSPRQLRQFLVHDSLPVVVKAATNETTGGGGDVAICHNLKDLQYAENLFRNCRHVVTEEYLPMTRNLCLNYAITAKGEISYLGSAEQISDMQGKYFGNWLDDNCQAPTDAIDAGRRVAENGYKHGYWGCVGMDMAIMEDGRILIFDLNFRINGSTAALLLSANLRKKYGAPAMRLAGLRSTNSYQSMIKAIYTAMDKGLFVPLVTCNPDATEHLPNLPRASGLILGKTRQHVRKHCQELKTLGLEVVGSQF